MKFDAKAQSPKDIKRAQPLATVLLQNEHIEALVEDSGKNLSKVNSDLKQELAKLDPLPGLEIALEKSELVEDQVEEVSAKLEIVNRALEGAVRERDMLDHQFAALTEQENASRHGSFHDVLTNLPNRALFNDRLEHGLAQAERHGRTLAVMFVDLDKFKSI